MSDIIIPDNGGRFGHRGGRRGPTPQHQRQEPAPILAASFPVDGPLADFHIQRHKEKIAKCPGDCGFDLYPMKIHSSKDLGERYQEGPNAGCLVNELYGQTLFMVDTGIKTYCPPGSYGRIVSRSSSIEALHGAIVIDGTIDSGYIGWLYVRILCHTSNFDSTGRAIMDAIFQKRALAQLIPTPCIAAVLQKVDMSGATTPRGEKGFGSTDLPVI